MKGQTTWIAHGQPLTMPENGPGLREDHTLQGEGFIKLVQGPAGTEIKWSVFAANWASLFYILDWTETFPSPVTLLQRRLDRHPRLARHPRILVGRLVRSDRRHRQGGTRTHRDDLGKERYTSHAAYFRARSGSQPGRHARPSEVSSARSRRAAG